jgi:hypothetical protein
MSRVQTEEAIADALRAVFVSPNVTDSNLEAANVVDAIDELSRAVWCATRRSGSPHHSELGAIDAHGEAIREAAATIATAIDNLAAAIRERGGS